MKRRPEGPTLEFSPQIQLGRGTASSMHSHSCGQLLYTQEGVLRVETVGDAWIVPAPFALWIPSEVAHSARAVRPARFHGVYARGNRSPLDFDEITLLTMPPLAHHLVDLLAGTINITARQAAERVLAEVLQPVRPSIREMKLPSDPRARDVADALLSDPGDVRSLREIARAVGSSPRTLLRLFVKETGLTFTEWRTHARLFSAIALIIDGDPIGQVALRVGYETPSSFTAAFRRAFGVSPRTYVQSITTQA